MIDMYTPIPTGATSNGIADLLMRFRGLTMLAMPNTPQTATRAIARVDDAVRVDVGTVHDIVGDFQRK